MLHYLSKYYEFIDSFLSVAAQRWEKLNFLHVFHHCSTSFPVWYLIMKYAPGGDPYYVCFLNSSVHVVMYFYYFLHSVRIRPPRILKVSVTLFQIVQFVTYLSQALYMETHARECPMVRS